MREEKKKRLWIACELYYPEDNTTGFYMTRLAEGLAPHLDVHALCGQPNYHRRGQRAAKRERRNGVSIFRVSSTTFDKNIALLKIINMISLSLSMFLGGLRWFKKGDDVLIVSAPPTILFTVGLAALLKGCSYKLLIHDNYPEMLVAAGTISKDSLLESLYIFLNRWLYKYTSRVIVVGRDMAVTAERKVGGLNIPVSIIPNWAELESVSPQDKSENTLLASLGLSEKFVLLYAGNMGYPQDIDSIYEASRKLADLDDVHFIFLGSGTKRRVLETMIERDEPSNITILPAQPRENQKDFLNACDIAFVSLIEKMKGVSVPSRTYNIMAAGKPILAITEPGSEISQIIAEENNGWTVSPGKPEDLEHVIREIYSRRDSLFEMGKRSRSAAVEKYSETLAVQRYLEILQ